jgi:3-oxoacyl-[acyl-carrier-protein] synthase III
MPSEITALGYAIPDKKIENKYFETFLDTTDEWIFTRTGIKSRYWAEKDEYCSDLCLKALENLKKNPKVDISDVDFIIVASVTGDQVFPSVSSLIQNSIGLKNCGAIDLSAACAGFVYGIILANALISSGTNKKILVFGAETLSKITDFSDRTSCVLFGDGAGVVLMESSQENGVLSTMTGSEGDLGHELYMSGYKNQINGQPLIMDQLLHQNGKAVFKWAVNTVSSKIPELLKLAGLSKESLNWFVPHSANQRILESICSNMDFPTEKTLESLSGCGNTSSASIPIAIGLAMEQGKVKKGDILALFGFGGGLVYAGVTIRWAID